MTADTPACLPAIEDDHPESRCQLCGGVNPVWSIESDRWNAAFPEHRGVIACPGCFTAHHQANTGMSTGWKLVPAAPFHWITPPGAITGRSIQ